MGVEGVEDVDVDGEGLREGECLRRNGSELETEGLVCDAVSAIQLALKTIRKGWIYLPP